MSKLPSKRLPEGYLDRLLPRVEDMISRMEGEASRAELAHSKRKKVHFYIDADDYERLERIVDAINRSQGILGDDRGLLSKVLRLSVKLGLREVESRLQGGASNG